MRARPQVRLHQYAEEGNVSGAEALLAEGTTPIDVPQDAEHDSNRPTPLGTAAGAGQVDMIRALVARGAAIEGRGGGDMTPLHFACAGLKPEAVRVLLELGADRNAQVHGDRNGGCTMFAQASLAQFPRLYDAADLATIKGYLANVQALPADAPERQVRAVAASGGPSAAMAANAAKHRAYYLFPLLTLQLPLATSAYVYGSNDSDLTSSAYGGMTLGGTRLGLFAGLRTASQLSFGINAEQYTDPRLATDAIGAYGLEAGWIQQTPRYFVQPVLLVGRGARWEGATSTGLQLGAEARAALRLFDYYETTSYSFSVDLVATVTATTVDTGDATRANRLIGSIGLNLLDPH